MTDDLYEPPIPGPAREPEWTLPEAWHAAERSAGRALAAAAEAVGRLDERLRRVAEAQRRAWRERLALEDISGLLWAEGLRLRPETLALADAGRVGRSDDEDRVLLRAQWARRRMTGPSEGLGENAATSRGTGRSVAGRAGSWAPPRNGQGVLAFLGRVAPVRGREDDTPDNTPGEVTARAWADLPEALIPAGPDPEAAARWARALADLDELHPLTRSAAAFHIWRRSGLSQPGELLEAAVMAARIAGSAGRGGLLAVPLTGGGGRLTTGQGGDAAERLTDWLRGLAQAADQAQLFLDRIELWHEQSTARSAHLNGKGAPALLALLAARPILSGRDTAEALSITEVQARHLLNRFEKLGLIRELTGHSRFRFWAAAI